MVYWHAWKDYWYDGDDDDDDDDDDAGRFNVSQFAAALNGLLL